MAKRARRKARLETWLNAVQTPVFLLSASRRVEFFNAGCEEETGWAADEVVGHLCEYATEGDHQSVQSLTGSLCPPPEVLAGREMSVPAYLTNREGKALPRLLHFFPLHAENGRVAGILGIITPIGEPARTADASPTTQLHAELGALRIALRQAYAVKTLVCRSQPMTRVLEQVRLARQSNTALLLHGEPGTGKEHFARLIHHESDAGRKSFVPLDCRRLPAHELKQTIRRLLEADGDESSHVPALQAGTVYLVDVEHLPRDLQVRLAEAFHADSRRDRLPLRLMASTTIELEDAVGDDRVCPEFYYLLTPLCIRLPPLRRRPEDLSLLAQHFLENLNRGDEKQVGGFAEDVWKLFRQYNWPGNLDELAIVVEEAHAACSGELVRGTDLPFRFRTGLDAQSVGPILAPKPAPLEPLLAKIEKDHIESVLGQCRQNKSKAAELLGLTRARLYRRMEALGIEDSEQP